MNRTKNEFEILVNRALRDSNLSHMRGLVEKELLIYDILFCLDELNILDSIVFQGGSLLRFGHGGERFSEDLDFVGGKHFSSSQMDAFKPKVEKFIADRYGFEIDIKQPKLKVQKPEKSSVKVYCWQVGLTAHPHKTNIPKQRIKLEIATVPSYTREIVALRSNYDLLPDGYDDILIPSESLSEVMADKLISYPATVRYTRYRDLWDLHWLIKRRIAVDKNLIRQKLSDYELSEFNDLLTSTIDMLPDTVNSSKFRNEMRQLLPSNAFNRTFGKEKFSEYLLCALRGIFGEARDALN